ncbi:MAG TPA: glycosidase, partial [Caldithrix sp.]|nr:glycosidase [Caldithrix sp.]
MKLERFNRNPILQPRGDSWESLAAYNCGAVLKDGNIHILYRAIGEYTNYVSRLGHAVFDTNLNLIERLDDPCFVPELAFWEKSVEDVRITPLDGKFYITYVVSITPCPPAGVRRRLELPMIQQAPTRVAVAETTDFINFTRLGFLTPYGTNQRDTVIFPERINGKIAVLHRPAEWIGPSYGTDIPGIWFAYLDRWEGGLSGHKLVLKSEYDWESYKIGSGPPPIKTEKGWLLIFHGVQLNRTYRAGAVLLDLEEPWKVIARTASPILEPETEYECIGDMPNVVFPEGAVVVGDELLVFYGGADKV